eukprot:1586576-Prymnesium_polylepis.1
MSGRREGAGGLDPPTDVGARRLVGPELSAARRSHGRSMAHAYGHRRSPSAAASRVTPPSASTAASCSSRPWTIS